MGPFQLTPGAGCQLGSSGKLQGALNRPTPRAMLYGINFPGYPATQLHADRPESECHFKCPVARVACC